MKTMICMLTMWMRTKAVLRSDSVKCEAKVENDGDSEQEDLWAADSEEETEQCRLKTFRQEDLKNQKFHSGQLFESVKLN